jgi:hypothetical protein
MTKPWRSVVMQKPIYIWDGSVGACVRERGDAKNRQTFYTFEFTRCFKRDGSDEFEYSNSFTARNADQLRNVLEQALATIAELDAESPQAGSAQAA